MTDNVDHLKELLSQRIDGIEKLITARQELSDKSLDLLAKNNEKHFSALNGEAERLRLMQVSYVPREVHEANINEIKSVQQASVIEIKSVQQASMKELQKELTDLRALISALQSFQANILGKHAIIAGVAALLSAMVSGIVVFLLSN